MNKDALTIEYSELHNQLQGISPKLESYQKIKMRMDEIKEIMAKNGTGLSPIKLKKTRSKSKKYLHPFSRF
jgi:hypothetical protein